MVAKTYDDFPDNGMQLPAEIAKAVSTARLPEIYKKAKAALAECESLDECCSWADKAAAIASYARQADDPELENYARRIRLRANRRLGELLLKYDGRGGKRSKGRPTLLFASRPTRAQVAKEAGISRHKAKTAVTIARVDDEDENAVESPQPPGTSVFVAIARQERQGAKADKVDMFDAFLRDERRRDASERVVESLLGIERRIDDADFDLIVEVLHDNREKARRVSRALAFCKRIESVIAKAGFSGGPRLNPVE